MTWPPIRVPISVVPLDRQIATAAAALRARLGGKLELPDALVVATAQEMSADQLITGDRNWPSRRALTLTADLRLL